MARDTDIGEKVAVKIVEREGRKRLGGGTAGNWGRGATLGRDKEKERRSERERKEAEDRRLEEERASSLATSIELKGKGRDLSEHQDQDPERTFQHQVGIPSSPTTRFITPTTPTKSPSSSNLNSRASSQGLAARYGRWGGGTPSRPTYADKELERAEKSKEKERAKRSMLWTTDKKVKREIAIMKKCSHENVVMLKEVIDDPQSKKIFMGELRSCSKRSDSMRTGVR